MTRVRKAIVAGVLLVGSMFGTAATVVATAPPAHASAVTNPSVDYCALNAVIIVPNRQDCSIVESYAAFGVAESTALWVVIPPNYPNIDTGWYITNTGTNYILTCSMTWLNPTGIPTTGDNGYCPFFYGH